MPARTKICLQVQAKLQENLKALMKLHKVKEADLSRNTQIPQGTLNNILRLGRNALISTAVCLARYFKITVGQLVGEEPIDICNIKQESSGENYQYIIPLPIILWQDLEEWIITKNINLAKSQLNINKLNISKDSFITFSPPGTEHLFGQNAWLIVDPLASISHNNYILASTKLGITIYKILVYNKQVFLKSIINTLQQDLVLLNENNKSIGSIVESRVDFQNQLI